MISRLNLRARPIKTVWRFSYGSNPLLPCHGVWVLTCCGGGGGSGATHASYALPSEHGFNASARSITSYYRSISSITLADGGVGGTLTNDADVTAQHGKTGGNTTGFPSGTASGGSGGRGSVETSGLSPTAPDPTYPNTTDTRDVNGGRFLGVAHSGGAYNTSPLSHGNGAAGNAAPPGTSARAGNKGQAGRADFYLRG